MVSDKINVKMSPTAFMKMQTLVMGFDKEVGWYGTVERIEDGFRIKDILLFPQYTSATYIDDERDDPLEFRKWLDTLSDDEYNSRRLWAHSHVDMGVSPSGTDTNMFKRFKDSCSVEGIPNRFTLCLIINKRLQTFWWAYDADANREYKDKDINFMVEVEEGQTNLEFFEWAKGLVRDIYPTTAFLFGSNGASSYGYKGYASGYNYGTYNSYAKNKTATKDKTSDKDKKTSTTKSKKIIDDYGVWSDWYDPYDDYYYAGYGAYGSYASQAKSDKAEEDVTSEKKSETAVELPTEEAVILKDYEVVFPVNGTNKVEVIEYDNRDDAVDIFDTQSGIYNNEMVCGNSYTFSMELYDLIPNDEIDCNTVIQYLLFYYFSKPITSFEVMRHVEDGESKDVIIDSEEAATEILNSEVEDCELIAMESNDGVHDTYSLIFMIK